MTKYKMIVATDMIGGIGKENKLPWPRNKKDMEWLKTSTAGAILIVGRDTFNALPKSILRENYNNNTFIVLQSNLEYVKHIEGCRSAHIVIDRVNGKYDLSGLERAVEYLSKRKKRNVFVFGGARIYEMMLPHVNELYITTFQNNFDCDAFVNRDALYSNTPYCVYRDVSDKEVVFEIFHSDLETAKTLAPYYERKTNKQTN